MLISSRHNSPPFSDDLAFSYSAGVGWLWAVIFISTVLAVASFWLGVKWLGPTKTSIISMVEPFVTVVLARLAFEETLAGPQLLGGALIFAGILILQIPLDRSKLYLLTKEGK